MNRLADLTKEQREEQIERLQEPSAGKRILAELGLHFSDLKDPREADPCWTIDTITDEAGLPMNIGRE